MKSFSMKNSDIFSWQADQWSLLWDAKKNNRMPHALLFAGAPGLGKLHFAEVFSAAMLCEKSSVQNKACGVCHACGLVRANSHPDLIYVKPEQAGQMIKIDQIREVVKTSNETAMQGGYKIIILHPAQAMNQNAANALLKTLEEATPRTLFILISEQNLRLPLTIQSRCQKIVFHKPSRQDALAWLQSQAISSDVDLELALNMAEGAPLEVLSLIDKGVLSLRQVIYRGLSDLSQGKADPLVVAALWQEYDIAVVFNLVWYWLRDLLRMQLVREKAELVNEDYRAVFLELVKKLSVEKLMQFVTLTQERYVQLAKLQNLNRQLLLEELLIYWAKYYVSR